MLGGKNMATNKLYIYILMPQNMSYRIYNFSHVGCMFVTLESVIRSYCSELIKGLSRF
jgi:hypothetical protein